MKKRKIFNKIMAVALSVMFFAVSVIPCYPSITVKAADDIDNYPEEIYFPIQILDFKADNLLFEYDDWGSGLCLGEGYVDERLEYDENGVGYPKYSQKKVEEIARNVQRTLEGEWRGGASQMPVLDTRTITDADGSEIPNPISLYTWIKSDFDDLEVLGTSYAGKYHDNNPVPASFITWKSGAGNHSARYTTNGSVINKWPLVNDGTKDAYRMQYDGLVLEPGTTVDNSFGHVPPGMTVDEFIKDASLVKLKKGAKYTVTFDRTETSNVTLKIDGNPIDKSGDPYTLTEVEDDAKNLGYVDVQISTDNTAILAESDTLEIDGFANDHAGNADFTFTQFEQGVELSGNTFINIGKFDPEPWAWRRGKVKFRVYSDRDISDAKIWFSYAQAGKNPQYSVKVNNDAAKTAELQGNSNWVTPVYDGGAYATNGNATINLHKGVNIIVIEGVGDNSAPYLGGIKIEKKGAYLIALPSNSDFGSNYNVDYNFNDTGWIRIEGETPTQNAVWDHGHGSADNGNCSGGKYENFYNGGDNVYAEYKVYSEYPDGYARTIRFRHALWDGQKNFSISVNGGANVTVPGVSGDVNSMGITQVEVPLRHGVNTIRVNLQRGVLDYFELDTYAMRNKISNIKLTLDGDKYPLGKYQDAVDYYRDHPDDDYFPGMTCMHYAYFVTSHFWKYKSGYNDIFGDYNHIIFHRGTDENGKIFYEFAADKKNESMDIIYNKSNGPTGGGTIRNAYGDDTGSTANGDIIKPGGSMFVVDERTDRPYIDMDRDYDGHNFLYSIVSRSKFVYKEEEHQKFFFSGDDDVYVFVNGYRYMDLGGTHEQLDKEIDLTRVAAEYPEWGIEEGKVVSLDLFYMERHTVASNFYSKMNFKLAEDSVQFNNQYKEGTEMTIPYGYVVPLNYQFSTLRELNTNSSIRFTDSIGNVVGCDHRDKNGNLVPDKDKKGNLLNDSGGQGGLRLAEGSSITPGIVYETDANGYAKKDADGNYIPLTDDDGKKVYMYVLNVRLASVNGENEKLKQFVIANNKTPTDEESAAVKAYFDTIKLEQDEAVFIDGIVFDTSYRKYRYPDEPASEKAKDIYKDVVTTDDDGNVTNSGDMRKLDFNTYAFYKAQQYGALEYSDGFQFEPTTVYLQIGSIKVVVPQIDNDKKNLDDYGAFKITRERETVYSEEFAYQNDPNALNGLDSTLAGFQTYEYTLDFKNINAPTRVTNIDFIMLSRGEYTLDVDDTVLTSYRILVNGEEVPSLTLKLEPDYDPDAKKWIYPEVEFELSAKRRAPDLRDLT